MLHLVHMPSGKVINVGDPLEDGLVRLTDSHQFVTNSTTGTRGAVPCVRVMDERGFVFSLFEERPYHKHSWIRDSRLLDYEVIGE